MFSVLSGFINFKNGWKTKQGVYLKFCFKTGKLATQTYDLLKATFEDKCKRRSMILFGSINIKMAANQ